MSSKAHSKAATTGKPRRPGKARTPQSHEVRIIGGQWKRSKLKVFDKPGLRPTPDRVRETLFNWLGQDLSGWRCLDAFAGTGVLGFEAASRGASQVQLVDAEPVLIAQLQKTKDQLQAATIALQRGDGVASIRQAAPASLDLIFLDPPFDAPLLLEPALRASARALAPGGWVFLEGPTRWTDEQLASAGLVVHKHLKAGAVHAHLLRLAQAPVQQANPSGAAP